MLFPIAITLLLSFVSTYGEQVDTKRLLLHDPDVLNDRLTKLESSMIQLQQTNKQQADTTQRLESTVHQLQQTNKYQVDTIQRLENTVTTLQTLNSRSNIGTTYTRWGRTSCHGNNTELVYSGYVGGGIYSEKGSSQDLLCVTENPVFGKTTGPNYGHLYGAEYDDDFYGAHANGEDMPCAVCHKKMVTSSVMIPGRNTCYPGWEEAYHGYLTTEDYGRPNGAEYICVDANPEYLVGGEVNTNAGRMLGPVIAKCGILKCPPYHDGYPITCVVCSK